MRGYDRRDWKIALSIVAAMMLIISMHLSIGSKSWGDDFAAYLAEGISISQNTFDEQIEKNYYFHPTNLPLEANEGKLVYVWGYPLLLSIVHHFVGFDLQNFSSIIYYKIPSMVALALTIGVLFLFYRKFFNVRVSLFLVLMFAVSGELIHAVDTMISDVVFLFFSVASIWLSEYFLDNLLNSTRVKVHIFLAVLLAIVLWLCYEARLSGQSVIIVAVLFNIISLIQNKTKLTFSRFAINLFAYILFFLLIVVSEAILAPATANLSDVGTVSIGDIGGNILYYGIITCQYLGMSGGIIGCVLGFTVALVFLVGFFREGFKLKNIHLSVFLAGTYIVLILLPYRQGIRYIYNILPIILLYVAHGTQYIYAKIQKKAGAPNQQMIIRRTAVALASLVVFVMYLGVFVDGVQNIKNNRHGNKEDVYSAEAIETYRYIQSNISDDVSIAFFKPRALYLNTGKRCFKPYVNGHEIEDADYFLYYKYENIGMQDKVLSDCDGMLTPIYQNDSFVLYKFMN